MVDENAYGLTARKLVLEEQGHTIIIAKTIPQALDSFAHGAFDLVITDHKMPRMNALDFIVALREEKPAIRIILLSGIADALGLTAENTGADAVLQKSAQEAPQLVRLVASVLAKKSPSKRKPAATEPLAPKAKRHSA